MKHLLALAFLPGAALAEEPWQGIWSADPAWCAAADDIGEVTPAPIRITADAVEGYENSCDIAGVAPLDGTSAYYVQLSCFSEGESYDERQVFLVDAHAPVLWIWIGSDAPIRFDKCE